MDDIDEVSLVHLLSSLSIRGREIPSDTETSELFLCIGKSRTEVLLTVEASPSSVLHHSPWHNLGILMFAALIC